MIRVLIADDHAMFREGLAALIRAQADMHVVALATDAAEALALCKSILPDVAVIDLRMPGGGLAAIERIAGSCPGVRTVAFTMHDDEAYMRATLAAGGAGYVIKGAAGSELMDAIRAVAAGQSYVCAQLGAAELRAPLRRDTPPPPSPLSLRERQVLNGLIRGFSNREIADQLELSTKTIDTYRARLQNKLGTSTRAELVAYALRAGLLSPEDGENR